MLMMMQTMMGAATVPLASADGYGDAFVFRIHLSVLQTSYTYPLRLNSTYDCTVDWGDGTVESFTENPSHVYASSGEYDVKIAGQCPAPRCQPSDGEKIIEVKHWGSLIGATDWSLAFTNTPSNFVISATDVFGAGVTNVYRMFMGSGLSVIDPTLFDMSDVENMDHMFLAASSFDADLSGWCVPKITEEPELFADSSALKPEHYPVWGTCP